MATLYLTRIVAWPLPSATIYNQYPSYTYCDTYVMFMCEIKDYPAYVEIYQQWVYLYGNTSSEFRVRVIFCLTWSKPLCNQVVFETYTSFLYFYKISYLRVFFWQCYPYHSHCWKSVTLWYLYCFNHPKKSSNMSQIHYRQSDKGRTKNDIL